MSNLLLSCSYEGALKLGRLACVCEELADQGDVQGDGEGYLVNGRGDEELTGILDRIKREVFRDALSDAFYAMLNDRHVLRFRFDRHCHAWSDEERAAVYFLAVDENVAMSDELLSSENGGCKFKPVHNAI